MTAIRDMTKFTNSLIKLFGKSVEARAMKKVGEFAATVIVKRTRLGFGVPVGSKRRKSLKAMKTNPQGRWSEGYQEYRKKNASKLHRLTRPKKFNLTLTGQLLESMGVIKSKAKRVLVGTKGARTDGFNNFQLANVLATNLGLRFNDLTIPEEKQVTRFYRRTFGDLVKRRIK